jgi:predicted short-subunit dehydrogenase-like oxidoreductase (DUF2520 family)
LKGKISFIGSGNVAWHLANAFDLAGYKIHQVISRNKVTGKELASKFAAYFDSRLEDILNDADFIFLTIPDKSISELAKKINAESSVFVHCAGSGALSLISEFKSNAAVFYPLQTFTKGRPLDYFKIPVFIEASNLDTFRKIRDLAESISNNVKELDSEKRRFLHLAAVIANNFTNHLLTQAEKLMVSHDLPFSFLEPLVEETVKKAFALSPSNSQTGPAIRHDESTLQKHLEMLEAYPDLRELYEIISKDIVNGAG